MREAHPQPLAFRAATVTAGHIGGGQGLVYEDEAFGFEVELAVEPVMPLLQDVVTVLLDSVPGLFLRVIPCRAKKRCTVPIPTGAPRSISRA